MSVDLNNIKDKDNLGTGVDNSYISFGEGLTVDLAGNSIVAILDDEAEQAADFGIDNVPPELENYVFDLNTGIILMTFSESINASSVQFNQFVLSSSSELVATKVSFTGGSTTTLLGTTFEFKILHNDLNDIKALFDLATSESNTFLSISSDGAYSDTSGNQATISDLSNVQATSFVNDTTKPVLESFDFYLSTGLLVLRFSETIDPSSFNGSTFTIQSSIAFPVHSLNLTGGEHTDKIGPELNFTINIDELNIIKEAEGFATARGNTFIAVSVTPAVYDTSGNPMLLISTKDALQVTKFISDAIMPSLDGYTLNMNTDVLTLTFTESIDTDILNPSVITLFSSKTFPTDNITLSESTVNVTGFENIVPIIISDAELNTIKATTTLAISNVTVFLSIKGESTEDVNGNLLEGIPDANAILPDTFIPDTTAPLIIDFKLILVEEPMEIMLTFNEIVNPATLTVDQFSIADNGSLSVTLNGSKSTDISMIVTITIDNSVLKDIRSKDGLATEFSSTFLVITSGAIKDAAGNPIDPVTFQVTEYDADLIPPEIIAYTFDLDAGNIVITFSEAVQLNTFNTSLLFLSNSTSSDNAIQLDQAIASSSVNTEIIVTLTDDIVVIIKLDLNFATSSENTYIYHNALLACDIANNCAKELPLTSAINATTFINDTTSPKLLHFDLNVNDSLITLTFNEVVDAETLDIRQFTLQNMAAKFPTVDYQLTGGKLNSTDGKVIKFFMTEGDRNEIQALDGLMELPSNTYLSITSDAIKDMSGNFVAEVRPRVAMKVSMFLMDTDNPQMTSATLDLDEGTLSLDFSESMTLANFTITDIMVVSDSTDSPSVKYTLTDSTLSSTDISAQAIINLSGTDLNNIKLKTICNDSSDCFLSFSSSLVVDTEGKAIVSRVSPNPFSSVFCTRR